MPAAGAGAAAAAAAVTAVAAITALTAPATAASPLSELWFPPPARPVTYDAAAPLCVPAPRALKHLYHWLRASRRAIGLPAPSQAPPPHVPTMCRLASEPASGRVG